jgi:hypothetical protein
MHHTILSTESEELLMAIDDYEVLRCISSNSDLKGLLDLVVFTSAQLQYIALYSEQKKAQKPSHLHNRKAFLVKSSILWCVAVILFPGSHIEGLSALRRSTTTLPLKPRRMGLMLDAFGKVLQSSEIGETIICFAT